MSEGIQYLEIVRNYFEFLSSEFGYYLSKEELRGNVFYDVHYKSEKNIISISYENIEDFLQVIIFKLTDGKLPDYDDKSKTLHLNRLTAEVISKMDIAEINRNNDRFSRFQPQTKFEKKLLKLAKELRLCLQHFPEFLNFSTEL